jgi:hypothetical protein
MELYLQFGYGMMEHCRVLVERWGGGTVILSPRDLEDDQLSRMSTAIRALPGGSVLLDPQFYLPHADHERLCGHEYWPDDYETGVFWQGPGLTRISQSRRDGPKLEDGGASKETKKAASVAVQTNSFRGKSWVGETKPNRGRST